MVGDPIGRLESSSDMSGFAETLRTKPVHKSITGILVSADYQICSEVLKSPNWRTQPETNNFFERLYLGVIADSEKADPFLDSIIAKDGPEHTRIRRLIQPAFTHRVMQSWKSSAEEIAKDLVSQIDGDSEIDFVEALANPLPLAMICEILGVPLEDREKFTRWGRTLAIIGLDLPRTVREMRELEAASDELTSYIAYLLSERKINPQDDLLSVLANAESEGDKLTDREIIATASFLLIAGFETTVNLLSVGTLVLLENRDQLRQVADNRDLVPNLVEEALRVVSPVQYTARTSDSDLELSDGTKVRRGQTIALIITGANRDPALFEKPNAFLIGRENARRNIAFGYGAHHCIGAQLARLEAETLWRELLTHFPNVESWQQSDTVKFRPGKTIRGLESMPMVLGAKQPKG
ncbi:MAG: cytochrome P450 [Rhodoluna sp.]|nr:cytochrome P450 [Rhodoluna sp.]